MQTSMSEPAPFVVATILTFRRRDLLLGTLRAVRSQTRPPDLVLVVDNDHLARELLEPTPGVQVIETGANLGPAGGYAIAFRLALDHHATKVWVVDDDVAPDPDCLGRLLAASKGADVLIPLQTDPHGFHGHLPSWCGPLFDAAVVRAIGVPRADLFFWAEDTEYFWRARTAGFSVRPVPEATVYHFNDKNHSRGAERDWRLYYEVRNSLYVKTRVMPLTLKRTVRTCSGVLRKLAAIIFLESGKRRSVALWCRGFWDFLRGRLGKVVAPEDWPGNSS